MSGPLTVDIVVLGAGPAGTIAAIKLQQLGYRVAVCTKPSRYPSVIEGISPRTFQAFENIGMNQLCGVVSPPLPRYIDWGERRGQANGEQLIYRQVFNAALVDELTSRDIALCSDEQVSCQWHEADQQWQIQVGKTALAARFMVDARGRQAPVDAATPRPAATVSLHQHWRRPAATEQPPYTAVAALAEGWLWYVHCGDGEIYTQLCCSGESARALQHSPDTLQQLTDQLEQPLFALSDATPHGELLTRGATPRLNCHAASAHSIAVGDAALAADPLSGNGIYQSISSALIAPAVVNTLLQQPANTSLAIEFYQARINHLYQRFGRLGREFYAGEPRYSTAPFWQPRGQWPDLEPSHAEPDTLLGTATRAVVEDDLIQRGEVVVTHNHPLGIWRIDGELAVERLRRSGTALAELP